MPQKKNTPIHKPPPPAPAPSLWNTVAEGFAFGTGSTIARNIFGSLWGSNSLPETKHTHTLTPSLPTIAECHWWRKMYEQCRQREDHTSCDKVLDKMEKACAAHPPLHFG